MQIHYLEPRRYKGHEGLPASIYFSTRDENTSVHACPTIEGWLLLSHRYLQEKEISRPNFFGYSSYPIQGLSMGVTSFSITFSIFLQLHPKIHCVRPLIARSTYTHARKLRDAYAVCTRWLGGMNGRTSCLAVETGEEYRLSNNNNRGRRLGRAQFSCYMIYMNLGSLWPPSCKTS